MLDVFVSYARTERRVAEQATKLLNAKGFTCFFDLNDIDGGQNFPDKIDAALRESKAVLCFWSATYFSRRWCMIECRDALAREILVPVAITRISRFDPPADLRNVNYFDLSDWHGSDEHEGWCRTLSALNKLSGALSTKTEQNVAMIQLRERAKTRLKRFGLRITDDELNDEIERMRLIDCIVRRRNPDGSKMSLRDQIKLRRKAGYGSVETLEKVKAKLEGRAQAHSSQLTDEQILHLLDRPSEPGTPLPRIRLSSWIDDDKE